MALTPQEREDLAAYLDGELDEEATLALEARLTQDAEARQELETLRQVQGLLDYLPRTEPSPNFTHRTLERLTLQARRPIETGKMPLPRRLTFARALAWTAALLLAGWGGYLAAAWWIPAPSEAPEIQEVLVEQLPLLERLRSYQKVPNLDFLRRLDHPDLFGEVATLPAGRLPLEKKGQAADKEAPAAEATPEERDRNRARLKDWRKHPERWQRLRDNAAAFLALPEPRRDELVRLIRDLEDQPSDVQARLQDVLDRYCEWLRGLEEPQRRQILDTEDAQHRLALVRRLRDEAWLAHQPRAVRERYASLDEAQRAELVATLRAEERRRREEWAFAAGFWLELNNRVPLPGRLTDFNPEVQNYVQNYLRPRLSPEEAARLDETQGRWPDFPRTLVELADGHPPALPTAHGPVRVADLPDEVLRKLKFGKALAKGPKVPRYLEPLRKAEGNRLQFGTELARLAADKRIVLPHELYAYNSTCLAPPAKNFLDKNLIPVLTSDEKLRLSRAENESRWPDYPLLLRDLAFDHGLEVPWAGLPDAPRYRWDNYRPESRGIVGVFPRLPRQKLRDFALFELSPAEREKLQLSPDDPDSWRRLTEAYFRKKAAELQRLRKLDRKKG